MSVNSPAMKRIHHSSYYEKADRIRALWRSGNNTEQSNKRVLYLLSLFFLKAKNDDSVLAGMLHNANQYIDHLKPKIDSLQKTISHAPAQPNPYTMKILRDRLSVLKSELKEHDTNRNLLEEIEIVSSVFKISASYLIK